MKEAVGAISSQMVPPEAAKAGEFDLAAAVDPSELVLRSAWEAWGPGGDIYTEWYRPWIGGARGVRRRLEKAGFKEITCYWAWPPPRSASPLYWLPLHSPRLIDYYFDSRPQSPALFVKLARSMLQILSRLGLHHYFFVPVCAVARKPAADLYDGFRESINMEIVKQCKKRGWREIPSELTWLLWTPGADDLWAGLLTQAVMRALLWGGVV